MKQELHCDIVKDLLPSYGDELCSETSRRAVEQHLEHCPSCQECWNMLQAEENMEEISEEINEEMKTSRAEKKTLKKIKSKMRKRTIIGSFVLAPLLFLWFWGFYLQWFQPTIGHPLSMEYVAQFQERFSENHPNAVEEGWNFVHFSSMGDPNGYLYVDDFYFEPKVMWVEGSLFPKMQLGNPSTNAHPFTFRILDLEGDLVVGETTVPVGEVSFSMKQLKKETPYILQMRDFPEEGAMSFTFQ